MAGGFMGWGSATGAGASIFGGTATGAGSSIFGIASTGGAGAGCVGTMMFWLGLGRKATVEWILTASATSTATAAVIKTTANVLPTSRKDLRRCVLSSRPIAVWAAASSSGTAL